MIWICVPGVPGVIAEVYSEDSPNFNRVAFRQWRDYSRRTMGRVFATAELQGVSFLSSVTRLEQAVQDAYPNRREVAR